MVGEFLGAVALMWPIHAVVGVLACAPAWLLTRRHVSWGVRDLSLFVVPWLVLTSLVLFGGRDVSFSSLLLQNVLLGVALVLGIIARAVAASRVGAWWLRAIELSAPSLVGIVLWARVPFLGE